MTPGLSLVRHYFPYVTLKQAETLEAFGTALLAWNRKINLISRKDVENLYEHHILYSLAPARMISFAAGERVIDVGTGGGLPGIPLSILFPDTFFHLIDRTGKKIGAVQDMVSRLGLKNVTAEQTSAEEHHKKYHYVVGRGVTEFSGFLTMVKHLLLVSPSGSSKNGILYLTGSQKDFTRKVRGGITQVIPVSTYFTESYFDTKVIVYCPSGKRIKEM